MLQWHRWNVFKDLRSHQTWLESVKKMKKGEILKKHH